MSASLTKPILARSGHFDFFGLDKAFWSLFFLILGLAVGLRAYLAFTQVFPFTAPDSGTYMGPALQYPYLPFDMVRTAGLPYLIALGLSVFKHPIGFIFVQNFLWFFSSVLFVLSLKKVFGFRWLGLCLLMYLGFVQKNLAFEFFILSEHAARCLYLIFVSLMLLGLRNTSTWHTVALAIVTLFNILVKPSAFSLIPVAFIFFFITWAFNKSQTRKVAANALVFLLLIGVPLMGYMNAFDKRIGGFTLSYFGGYNFFAHVGHFTNLDSTPHAEIKKELKAFFPLYVEKYAAQGRYRPNWLIHNSFDKEMMADFGVNSPQRTILKHSGQSARIANQIFMDLSLEGVLSNKGAYALYAVKSTWRLFRQGLTFTYGNYFSWKSLKGAWASKREFAEWFKPNPPVRWLRKYARENLNSRPVITWPESDVRADVYKRIHRLIYHGTVFFKNGVIVLLALGLLVLGPFIGLLISKAFQGQVPVFRDGLVSLPGTKISLGYDQAAGGLILGMTIAAYSFAMGMYLVSDPPRFLLNIQDLLIAFLAVAATFGAGDMRQRIQSFREQT